MLQLSGFMQHHIGICSHDYGDDHQWPQRAAWVLIPLKALIYTCAPFFFVSWVSRRMTTDRVQAVLPNCIWTKAELACSSIRINTLAQTVHESFIREVAMAGTQSELNRQYHDGMFHIHDQDLGRHGIVTLLSSQTVLNSLTHFCYVLTRQKASLCFTHRHLFYI